MLLPSRPHHFIILILFTGEIQVTKLLILQFYLPLRYKNLQLYNKEFTADCSKYEHCGVLGTMSRVFVDGTEIKKMLLPSSVQSVQIVSSETSVFIGQPTWLHIPEDLNF